MKKILSSSLIILTIAVVVWWAQKPAPTAATLSPVQSPEEIVGSDFEKIEKNLKPENIKTDEWKEINNFAANPEVIVTQKNAIGFLKTAQNNLPELYSCLKKDFCGMESSENDPYFDEERTPAHIVMNRSLKVIKESLNKNPALSAEVNWELLEELAHSGESMLEVEAVDIINKFNPAGKGLEDTLKMSRNYTGTAKAEALVRLSENAKNGEKRMIANEIEEIFASADAHTVISVLENMDQMKLGPTATLKTFNNLCRFKENSTNPGNWKMIDYLASKLNPEFKKICL